MNSNDLLTHPAPAHLIALELDDETRTRCLHEQRQQFERGLLLWLKTHHRAAHALMKESLTVLSALYPDDATRQFWWLAEGAVDTLSVDSAEDKQLAAHLAREIKHATEGTYSAPPDLVHTLWTHLEKSPISTPLTDTLRQHFAAKLTPTTAEPLATDNVDFEPQVASILEDIAPVDAPSPFVAEHTQTSSAITELDLDDLEPPAEPVTTMPLIAQDNVPVIAEFDLDNLAAPDDELPQEPVATQEDSTSAVAPLELDIPELDDVVLDDAPPLLEQALDETALLSHEPPLLEAVEQDDDPIPLPSHEHTPEAESDMPLDLSWLDEPTPTAAETPPMLDSITIEPIEDTPPTEDVPHDADQDEEQYDALVEMDILPDHETTPIPEPIPEPIALADNLEPQPEQDSTPSQNDPLEDLLDILAPEPVLEPVLEPALEPVPETQSQDAQITVLTALISAVQSNWRSIANGSASYFGLFRDALGMLEKNLPALGVASLSHLTQALALRADELPLAGPDAEEADLIEHALGALAQALPHYRTLYSDELATLDALATQLEALTPTRPQTTEHSGLIPEASISALAAELDHFDQSATVVATEESTQVPSNHSTFVTHGMTLLHRMTTNRQHPEAIHLLATEAEALAIAAGQMGLHPISELAGCFATALERSQHHPEPLLEMASDILAVLTDQLEATQRGETPTAAPDLIEVLSALTPDA